MEEQIEYHFSLMLEFEKDIDLDTLEQEIGMQAHSKISLADSVIGFNNKKTAKIWWKSEDFTSINTYEVLEMFLINIENAFLELPLYFEKFKGSGIFDLIFTHTSERPIIELTERAVQILSKLKLGFSVDFI